MDLDLLQDVFFAMLVSFVPFALLFLWRKHIPGIRGMVGFNTVPPFRAWTARPHPDAAVPVETGSRAGKPRDTDAAHATVVVRTAWGAYPGKGEGPGWRQARPLTPVVLADGVPASSGWGVTRLTLTPGTHLIAVTGGHSRCYKQVHLGRGDLRELDYRCVIGGNADEYREGHGSMNLGTYLTTRARGLRGGSGVQRILLGTVALALLLAFALSFLPSGGDLIAIPLIGLPVLAGIGIAVYAIRQGLRKPPTIVAEPPPHGAPHEFRVLDDDEPEQVAPAPGWAALGLHLHFWLDPHTPEALRVLARGKPGLLQRWRVLRVGEPELPAWRPWVPAPEVTIDGRPVEADWARMWAQLPPGEHDLQISVPVPQRRFGPQTRLDLDRAEWRRRVFLTEGGTLDLDLLAHVTAVPHPDRPELAEYRVRL